MTPNEIATLYGTFRENAEKLNSPEKYIGYWTRAQAQFLSEIAYQLAIMNERHHKQAEEKQNSRKVAGHREQRSVMRHTSNTVRYRVSNWNLDATLDMFGNLFTPDEGQPWPEELEKLGDKTVGKLGTLDGVAITRISQ